MCENCIHVLVCEGYFRDNDQCAHYDAQPIGCEWCMTSYEREDWADAGRPHEVRIDHEMPAQMS